MGKADQHHQSLTATVLADLIAGTWHTTPPGDWRLERILNARPAIRATATTQDVLVPVRNPTRSLSGLEDSTLGNDAAVLLVQDEVSESTRFAVLRVASIDDALNTVAARRRSEFPGKVVAVTGSVGKTTTKTMIGSVLSQAYDTYWRPDNRNGLPAVRDQCVAMAQQRYAVIEIARIGLPKGAHVLRPDVAIVTAVSEAHMEDMGSLEGIARFKAQIFTGLNQRGSAVVNRDTPHADILLEAAHAHAGRVITYGVGPEADVRLLEYDAGTDTISIDFFGRRLEYRSGASGTHNALNTLAAICAIHALGEDVTRFIESFKSLKLQTGRGETSQVSIGGKDITLVDQSYNANPSSMRAALKDFATRFQDSRRILVLGDMRELGPTEDTLHADLLEPVMEAAPNRVYLIGPLMMHLWSRLPEEIRGVHVSTTAQLHAVLAADLRKGDTVLMKASRDTGLKNLVGSLSRAGTVQDQETWRVTISGPSVQRVTYRRWLQERALLYNVDGWVRNRSDGKVEALLAGRKKDLEVVSSSLHTGPPEADVSQVNTRRVSTVPRAGFRLRRTRVL